MVELNRNELEAMRVLWGGGARKPAEIQEQFGWPIDNGTLRSVLRVLMAKGLVTRRKAGKAFVYRAKESRTRLLSSMARRMAEVFADGSAGALIAQLVQTEQLTPSEIDELQRIVRKGSSGQRAQKHRKEKSRE